MVPEVLRRPVVAGVVLLVAYVGLSLLMDPNGYLGTDTGGKVATLEAMDRNGTLEPDVGYWAAEWDPGGSLHPLYYTSREGDQFVNVTTLPMVILGEPLYALGGYRLALLLPMLGAVAAAYAARALARRLGDGDGMAAFWLVGLASPLTIYALDFWEHSIGTALLAWGIVALVAAHERQRWWHGLAAGAAFGVAFTMRTEALVYAFVATAVVCVLVLVNRRSLLGPIVLGIGVVAGVGGPVLANQAIESRLIDSTLRTSRAVGAASLRGTGRTFRLREGLVTTFSMRESNTWGTVVFGVLIAGLLALAVYLGRHGALRDQERRLFVIAAALVGLIYALRFVGDGLGFVPGFVFAAPLAVVALVAGWRDAKARALVAIALAALPLVWAFQFSGGAVPQWGGRYVLTTSFLLAVVGVAVLRRHAREVAVVAVVLSTAVTAFGVAWLGERSRAIHDVADALEVRPEPALVSTASFFLRELGPVALDHRWLSTDSLAGAQRAVEVVEQAGIEQLALLQIDDGSAPPTFAGWQAGKVDRERWLGSTFRIITYDRT